MFAVQRFEVSRLDNIGHDFVSARKSVGQAGQGGRTLCRPDRMETVDSGVRSTSGRNGNKSIEREEEKEKD